MRVSGAESEGETMRQGRSRAAAKGIARKLGRSVLAARRINRLRLRSAVLGKRLFGVYASTDKAAQSKNYYPWHVEGITPTYDGEDLSIAGDSGFGFFLIDQRVIFFVNGKPNSMLDGGFSPNLMLDLDGVAMFGTPLDANRSCTYWEGDSQWAGREFDTCYLNELLAGAPVQDGLSTFARNSAGIFYAGSFPVDAASGEQLFITYNGKALRFLGDVDGVQLSAGCPVIEVGKAARPLRSKALRAPSKALARAAARSLSSRS